MTEEELKLLDKIDGLPKDLNIEIRGLILAEVFFREENKQLKEQLQQKEDIINKAKVDLEKHLNAKSYGNHKYELFDREYLEEVLEILNNKGDKK